MTAQATSAVTAKLPNNTLLNRLIQAAIVTVPVEHFRVALGGEQIRDDSDRRPQLGDGLGVGRKNAFFRHPQLIQNLFVEARVAEQSQGRRELHVFGVRGVDDFLRYNVQE